MQQRDGYSSRDTPRYLAVFSENLCYLLAQKKMTQGLDLKLWTASLRCLRGSVEAVTAANADGSPAKLIRRNEVFETVVSNVNTL